MTETSGIPDIDDAAAQPDILRTATLVYIAPRTGTSGVSDYADDMIEIAAPAVGRLVEVRHGGAGQDSVLDILRGRREIRRAVRSATGPVIVHSELSGGVLLPFWGLLGVRTAVVSSILHDAPLGVWLPLRTRLVSRSKLVTHGLHYPLMPIWQRVERAVLRRTTLVTLTRSGAAQVARIFRRDAVDTSFLPVPRRPDLPDAEDRPLAVGLFGYVYKGKGFEQLEELRARIDPSIELKVAGRGTQHLPPVPGITIVGPVEGEDEDAYFASIRALVVPYSKRSSYGPETHVASSAIARSLSYATPVIALRYPGLDDEALAVDGGIADLADVITRTIPDRDAVRGLSRRAQELRASLTTEAAFERLADVWRRGLARS